MIRSAVLMQSTRVTDGRTDGRTDGITVAYTRYIAYMLSRVKMTTLLKELKLRGNTSVVHCTVLWRGNCGNLALYLCRMSDDRLLMQILRSGLTKGKNRQGKDEQKILMTDGANT